MSATSTMPMGSPLGSSTRGKSMDEHNRGRSEDQARADRDLLNEARFVGFGHMSGQERRRAEKLYALRIEEIERRAAAAKLIKGEAEQVLVEAKAKLIARGIELAAKAGADTSDFASIIEGHFDDLMSDTFGYAVRKIEDEI